MLPTHRHRRALTQIVDGALQALCAAPLFLILVNVLANIATISAEDAVEHGPTLQTAVKWQMFSLICWILSSRLPLPSARHIKIALDATTVLLWLLAIPPFVQFLQTDLAHSRPILLESISTIAWILGLTRTLLRYRQVPPFPAAAH
jgi:hypothetical protein